MDRSYRELYLLAHASDSKSERQERQSPPQKSGIRMVKSPEINHKGHLTIAGCDLVELAERHGTPLLLLDEAAIRRRCREYLGAFRRHYPEARVLYAGKAFLTTGMCRLVESEGLSLDVVSGGELATALAAGFPMSQVWFHGNNKSQRELEMGLEHGIGRFVLDSGDEIERLSEAAARRGCVADVQIRVTPGIKPSTHSYIQTGQVDSKFGFSIANDLALNAVAEVLRRPSLRLHGIHCHIGSQIHEIASYTAEVSALVQFLENTKARLGYVPRELNLGGGLGIAYLPQDQPPSVDDYVSLLADAVRQSWPRLGAELPIVMVEPGRSIVGEAGVTLYRIDTVKEIPGVRVYAAVDGGMTDNLRVALYQARYHGRLANRMRDAAEYKVSIAGKCCETGDMIAWDLDLPRIRKGDLLAVFSTGAYTFAMANNYNRIPRLPVLLLHDGQASVLVRRETYDDVLSHDEIPPHLNGTTCQLQSD